MAESTTLEEDLGEVLGLAQAAQDATEKVHGLIENEEIVATLEQMRGDAGETERRCTDLAYLRGDADGLDGFEFLTMAEAGEVGHWAVLGKLNESPQEDGLSELVQWALPIQERHFAEAKHGSLQLAAEKDPHEES